MKSAEIKDRSAPPSWLSQLMAGMPAHRALVCDLLRLHSQMPSVAQTRMVDLASLREIRDAAPRRIAWPVLFLKAYAVASTEFPCLRRTYLTWPWPYFYEHSVPVANLAVARTFRDEDWLLFAPIVSADRETLTGLQVLVERYQREPVEKVFKLQVRLAHFPGLVRRVLWWLRMNASPRKRIKRLGTFALTTLARHGVSIVAPKAPVTTTLTYGPFDDSGRCQVTIAYDHRVMDGKAVACVLNRLEEILQTTIADELRSLAPADVKAAA